MARGTTKRRRQTARSAARAAHGTAAYRGPRIGAPAPEGDRARRAARRSRWPFVAGVAVVLALAAAVAGYLVSRGQAGEGADVGAISVLRTSDFHSLAFSPDDPNVVIFGHHNGVMRSDDGGRTWRSLVERRNFDAMGLAVSRANPRQVYLAGHDVFQVSADGGATWQPLAHDLPGTDIHGFAMSPDDPGPLYAFVVGHGAFHTGDGGRTWQRLGGQLPSDVMALAASGGSPETLYAGSMQSGVLKSADGGQSWSRAGAGMHSRNVMALAVDPVNRQTVYAGVEGGLYKSTDGGETWTKLPYPGDNAVALAVNPSQPHVLLAIAVRSTAAGRHGLVYRSEDSGMTWGGRK